MRDIFENHRITYGGDFRHMNFRRTGVMERQQQAFGAFVQDEMEINRFSLENMITPVYQGVWEENPCLITQENRFTEKWVTVYRVGCEVKF